MTTYTHTTIGHEYVEISPNVWAIRYYEGEENMWEAMSDSKRQEEGDRIVERNVPLTRTLAGN